MVGGDDAGEVRGKSGCEDVCEARVRSGGRHVIFLQIEMLA